MSVSGQLENPGQVENPCPQCSGSRVALEARCEACGWRPAPVRSPPLKRAAVTAQMLLKAASTTTIASLCLVTALVAVCAAAITFAPVPGVMLSCVCGVALLRTALYTTYSKADGVNLGITESVVAFILSALLVAVLEAAASIAFVAVCLKVTQVSRNISVGLGVGGIVALVLTVIVLSFLPAYRRDE